MSKPWYQHAISRLGFTVMGALFFGGALDTYGNALEHISVKFTRYGTFAAAVVWVLAQAVLKFWPVRWVASGGQQVRIKQLGSALSYGLLGFIIVLWIPRVLEHVYPRRHPYPWIYVTGVHLEDRPGEAFVQLNLGVREHPRSKDENPLLFSSLATLFNLHIMITTPSAVAPSGARNGCTLAEFKAPELNNGNTSRYLAEFRLVHEVTLVQIRASARNGRWGGNILIRKRDKGIEWDAAMSGRFEDEKTMIVREKSQGNQELAISDGEGFLKMDTQAMLALGLPLAPLEREQQLTSCAALELNERGPRAR